MHDSATLITWLIKVNLCFFQWILMCFERFRYWFPSQIGSLWVKQNWISSSAGWVNSHSLSLWTWHGGFDYLISVSVLFVNLSAPRPFVVCVSSFTILIIIVSLVPPSLPFSLLPDAWPDVFSVPKVKGQGQEMTFTWLWMSSLLQVNLLGHVSSLVSWTPAVLVFPELSWYCAILGDRNAPGAQCLKIVAGGAVEFWEAQCL